MPTSSSIPHPHTFVETERLRRIKGYVVHERRTPDRPLIVTPTQTIGPFYPRALIRPGDDDVAAWSPQAKRPEGEPIVVCGKVLDVDGRPVSGALVEVWQANRHGKYEHPSDTTDAPLDPDFKGYGRALTQDDGDYRFVSIKPAGYPNPGYDAWLRPPHIHFSVFAAGVMHRLVTQMYFPGEPLNDIDPILNGIEDLDARHSLIAKGGGQEQGVNVYRFDIVLQGAQETQFFLQR